MKKAEHICDAAAKYFALHGFEGVSMRDLAEACEVTTSALYYHFPSKEALHDEVTERSFDDLFDAIATRWRGTDDRAPSTLIGIMFDEALRDPCRFLLLQRDMHYHGEGQRFARSRKRYLRICNLIGEALELRSGVAPDSSEVFLLTALIAGACELTEADPLARNQDSSIFREVKRAMLVAHVERTFD